ncbi:MAG TPA: hypothetical protein VFS06_17795 [Casimicrobiaceae bacterium]|jgi:hypothetical protein|nr:hypothetical protein [Casimicrobiaceae bacterium]HWD16400.1 hypothetical protein [Casimicrobiaceae bacterium]
MRIWFPLLAVPTLALLDQSVAYVTSVWACTHQNSIVVHVVHAPFFVAGAIGIFVAWQCWRELAPVKARDDRLARRHFLAGVAIGASALSTLVIVAMWGVTWVLRPCVY